MFSLRCKRLQFQLVPNWKNAGYSTTHFCFLLQSQSPFIKSFSSVEIRQPNQNSFTVSYLINSCGLSPEIAATVSKKVTFENPEKPDSVLGLLRQNGFTNAHISKLVKRLPKVLLGSIEGTLLPKLQFFHSVGISGIDLANVLSSNPSILVKSLEKQIIPNYNFLKSLVSNNEKIVTVWKGSFHLHDVQKKVAPNISSLRGIGVTQSAISTLLFSNPGVLCENSENFNVRVKKVIEMEFDPSTGKFVHALIAVGTTSHNCWGPKVEAYRSWGWSENDFWLAFRRYPRCMTLSVENINTKMDFYVNKMCWQPSSVARVPLALAYSLEKRIIPRCSVVRVLLLKGLIKKKFSIASVLMSPEKYFIYTFLTPYQEQVPQLLDIFHGKLGLSELGIGFEQKSEATQL